MRPSRHLPRIVGLLAVSTALLAPVGSALAAPQSVRQPALRPVDDQGLLDSMATSVASKSTQLMSTVRDGTSNLLDSAMNFLGVRYKLGGNTAETGFDCSGFTRYVYKLAGKNIPRTSAAQRYAGKTVSRAKAQPGDLVWFSDFRHVAIYAGNGYIIDAPKPGKKVAKRKLWTSHVRYIRVAG